MFPFDLSQTRNSTVLFFFNPPYSICVQWLQILQHSSPVFQVHFSKSAEPDLAQVTTVHLVESSSIGSTVTSRSSHCTPLLSPLCSACVHLSLFCSLTSCFFFCPQSTSQLGISQLKIALIPFGDVVKYESKIKQTAQTTQEEESPGSPDSGSQSHSWAPQQGRQCLPGTPAGLVRHWLLLSQDWKSFDCGGWGPCLTHPSFLLFQLLFNKFTPGRSCCAQGGLHLTLQPLPAPPSQCLQDRSSFPLWSHLGSLA